jgi:hypothetical protein
LSVQNVYTIAIAKAWKSWFQDPGFVPPKWMGGPIVIVALLIVAQALIAVGIFFVWREGERSEFYNAPPGPSDGIPNVNIYLATLFIWFAGQIIMLAVGPFFFEFKMFLVTAIILSVYWLCTVAIFVLSILIWYVPAILIGIGMGFILFATIVAWYIWWYSSRMVDGHTLGAVEVVKETVVTRANIQQRQQLQYAYPNQAGPVYAQPVYAQPEFVAEGQGRKRHYRHHR